MNFPNALNAYVTDNEFLVIMPSPEGSIGFISTQEDIMKTFSQLFDEYWDQSMDIKEFLKKYKYK
jgi:predicted RNase H-like HicB family nuclease